MSERDVQGIYSLARVSVAVRGAAPAASRCPEQLAAAGARGPI